MSSWLFTYKVNNHDLWFVHMSVWCPWHINKMLLKPVFSVRAKYIAYEGHSIKIVTWHLFSSCCIKPTTFYIFSLDTLLLSIYTKFQCLDPHVEATAVLRMRYPSALWIDLFWLSRQWWNIFTNIVLSSNNIKQNYVRQGQYCREVMVKVLTLYLQHTLSPIWISI